MQTDTIPQSIHILRRLKLGERCFAFAGPAAWNSLPSYIQEQSNTDTFKRHLKTFLFEQCYSSSLPWAVFIWFYIVCDISNALVMFFNCKR